LNYPLIIFNVSFFSFVCLAENGGTIQWLMVFTAIIPAILLPVSFIMGLVKDIKYLKN